MDHTGTRPRLVLSGTPCPKPTAGNDESLSKCMWDGGTPYTVYYSFDFARMLDMNQCTDDQMHDWLVADANNEPICLLGQQMTYRIQKASQPCYQGAQRYS